MTHESFFLDLPVVEDFVEIANPRIYTELPDSWHIVVTDVKDSTGIIRRGGYKQVNLLGASSIMAMLNLTKTFSLPFVFGGDGAIVCIPDSLVGQARQSLVGTKLMARDVYGIDLRTGIVPVRYVRENGHTVLVARYRISNDFAQAVFSAGGLQFAEECVKDLHAGSQFRLEEGDAEPVADSSGLECRWKNVRSPGGEVVTLIVQAIGEDTDKKNETYRETIGAIRDIYGADAMCRPVREQDLSMTFGKGQLSGESSIRSHGKGKLYRIWYSIRIRYGVITGWCLMKFNQRTKTMKWGEYKSQLAANTDYKKFDDKLKQVLAGDADERRKLTDFLERKVAARELVYGLNVASTALVTCLIFNYNGAHVHLVDSDDGGYAVAAAQLEKRLQQI